LIKSGTSRQKYDRHRGDGDDILSAHAARILQDSPMPRIAASLLVGLLLLCAAVTAAGAQSLSCRGTQRTRQVAELLFGRSIAHQKTVSDAAWARFVAHELTPRFPDGLTVTDAIGQWRYGATGRLVRERSKQVEIVLPGNVDDEARLDAAVAAYKRQFHQHSVGVIVRPACVSF
jgi:hypothetical protein